MKLMNSQLSSTVFRTSRLRSWDVCFVFRRYLVQISVRWPYIMSPSVLQWLSCLPVDPSFAGSNPAEYNGFLRSIKIRSMTSTGGKLKPSAPCRKILRNVKNPYIMKEIFYVKFTDTSRQVSLTLPLVVCAGYCQDGESGTIKIK
jgi:hypothetical protein